ncbi:unnamed protein product [Lota lota]
MSPRVVPCLESGQSSGRGTVADSNKKHKHDTVETSGGSAPSTERRPRNAATSSTAVVQSRRRKRATSGPAPSVLQRDGDRL